MISTKGVETQVQESKSYKGLNAGVYKLAIMDTEIFTAQSGKNVINLYVEDDVKVDEGYDYTGVLGKHKASHNMASLAMGSWFSPGEGTGEILANLASIADAVGVREQVDSIAANTIEDFVLQFTKLAKGKYFYTMIQSRQYLNNNGDIKTSKNIKTMKGGDSYIVLAKPLEGFEIVDGVTLTDGKWSFSFNPEYDEKVVAKPDADPEENPIAGAGSDDMPF